MHSHDGGGGARPAAAEDIVDTAHSAKLYEDVPPMPLMALNHIARLCRSVDASVRFYVKALGFVLIHLLRRMVVQLRRGDPPGAARRRAEGPRREPRRRRRRAGPHGQPHLVPVRGHGGDGAAAPGDADQVHEEDHQRGGRVAHRPALLQGPRRIHDRDLQLREPRARPRRRARTPQAPPRQTQPARQDGPRRRRPRVGRHQMLTSSKLSCAISHAG